MTHDGATYRELRPEQRMTFGRAPDCDLVFEGDSRLSRRAGQIHHLGPVVAVTNLSGSHSLFVHAEGATRERLLPTDREAEPASRFLTSGTHEVTSPRWEDSGCRIVITIDAPARVVHERDDDTSEDRLQTLVALNLNPATKEFATALVLCRPKLLHGPTAQVPPVPELTRAVLAATGSQHLLDRFDADAPASPGRPKAGRTERDKLVGRVHDHLKQLRAKVFAAELTTSRELRPHELADVLIENDVITPAHLDLLADPEWLTTQESLWWSER
jgi:hypothetical protein